MARMSMSLSVSWNHSVVIVLVIQIYDLRWGTEKTDEARKLIVSGIIGLAIILSARPHDFRGHPFDWGNANLTLRGFLPHVSLIRTWLTLSA